MLNVKNFFKLEAASGILLLIAAALALIIENSPYQAAYSQLLNREIFHAIDLRYIVNNALMVLFFFQISLELKREVLTGELSSLSKILLPAIAAIGGMVIPALIYIALNWGYPEGLAGWAIPVATDIAFAVGILALFQHRIPYSLTLFLLSLAIFDDVGAIIIIAFFHSHDLNLYYLLSAAAILLGLCFFNAKQLWLYLLIGVLFWFCVLNSGIHATIAGVLLALTIPADKIEYLEEVLHPWVSFVILPLFAFANAGFSLTNISMDHFMSQVTLGIICGLFMGKQLGVFLFSWLTIKSGYAKLPKNATWRQLYGIALICGIGFTMSLFLGTLAFGETALMDQVKLGVLLGSCLSALCGALVLI